MSARKYHQAVVHQISATVGFADNGPAVAVGIIPAVAMAAGIAHVILEYTAEVG